MIFFKCESSLYDFGFVYLKNVTLYLINQILIIIYNNVFLQVFAFGLLQSFVSLFLSNSDIGVGWFNSLFGVASFACQ